MSAAGPANLKTTWLILFGAFTVMPLLLLFVKSTSHPVAVAAAPNQPIPPVLLMSAVAWAAAIYWTAAKVRPGLPPQQFNSNSLVALALSEFGMLIVFALTMQSGTTPLLIAGGGTILVNLLVILPAGLRYFAAR